MIHENNLIKTKGPYRQPIRPSFLVGFRFLAGMTQEELKYRWALAYRPSAFDHPLVAARIAEATKPAKKTKRK